MVCLGGGETRSEYVRYVQGIQPNVPARTMSIDIYSYHYCLNRFNRPRFVLVGFPYWIMKFGLKVFHLRPSISCQRSLGLSSGWRTVTQKWKRKNVLPHQDLYCSSLGPKATLTLFSTSFYIIWIETWKKWKGKIETSFKSNVKMVMSDLSCSSVDAP